MENIPLAIAEFQGRVLVGVGSVLRIYDLGRKQLLRKCENKNFPVLINQLHVAGDRIYASDVAESVHFLKVRACVVGVARAGTLPPLAQYKRTENVLGLFADDVTPRHVTCFVPLDYDTVALGDKFGNIVVLRLPADVSEDVDNPSGIRILWDTGLLNGAPNKVELVCSYYVGEAVLSLRKAMLPGSTTETIVYRCARALQPAAPCRCWVLTLT